MVSDVPPEIVSDETVKTISKNWIFYSKRRDLYFAHNLPVKINQVDKNFFKIRHDENLRRILFLERLLISRLCNKIENGNSESATFCN